MKLYASPASPYVRKVLVVARERGLADRLQTVAQAAAPHQPSADYARVNPLMKIPALERDDGTLLYDSAVICEYLDTLGSGPRLFPTDGEARWQALRRHALADGVMDASILLRYELAMRPEALRWPEFVDGQYAKVDQGLDAFEREVDALPAALDIGQIGLVCALGYLDFRFAFRPWRDGRPKLARWCERMHERASLRATVPTA